MTEKEITEKYSHIEGKIPSVWPDFQTAGIHLAQDLAFTWDVRDAELIRVIALVSIRCKDLNLSKHIDQRFAVAGLYPEIMKVHNILPETPK